MIYPLEKDEEKECLPNLIQIFLHFRNDRDILPISLYLIHHKSVFELCI